MRIGVVINPISWRRGRAGSPADREALVRSWLGRHRIDAEIAITSGPGHAAELARSFVARGFDRVAAWGGDGTANEVAGPLIGTSTALGLLRAGSGDGFARGLGVPVAVERALELAINAQIGRIDVGWLGDRHFLNAGGVGFDAAVAREFSRRRDRGFLAYLSGGLTGVWTYRCVEYTLDLDGRLSSAGCFLVAFANGRQYGNGMMLAPNADPADGLLDVVIVDPGSPVRQLWRGRRLLFAPGRPAAGVRRTRVRTAAISAEHLACHVDGEPFDASGVVKVRISPLALAVAANCRPASGAE